MKLLDTITITMPCIPPKKKLLSYNQKDVWRYKKENAEFIAFKNHLILTHQKEISSLREMNELYKEKLVLKVEIIITKKMSDSFAKKTWVEKEIDKMFCNQKPDTDNIRKSLFDAIFSTPKEVIVKGKRKIRWSGFDERIAKDDLVKMWGDSDSISIQIFCYHYQNL